MRLLFGVSRPPLARCAAGSILLVALCGAPIAGVLADEPAIATAVADAIGSAGSAELQASIAALGAASYQERERALEAIVAIGAPAIPALEEATRSPDIEIAHRARRAIERVRLLAFERRLTSYLAGEPVPGGPLLAQRRFEELCGSDPADREFFVALLRAEQELALRFERSPERFPEAFRRRFESVLGQVNSRVPLRTPPSVDSIAALMLVLTDPSLEHPPTTFAHGGWSLLANQAYFQAAVAAPQRSGERLRAIVGQWILAPSVTLDVSAKSRLSIEMGMSEGIAFAAKYAGEEDILPSARPYAIQTLAVLGGRDHAARLLPLLEDEAICTTRFLPDKDGNNVRMPIQVCDVALGWLLFLSDQNPRAYGYSQLDAVFERVRTDPANVHSASNFWFASPADRDAALAQWDAWLKEHPLPDPPSLEHEAR